MKKRDKKRAKTETHNANERVPKANMDFFRVSICRGKITKLTIWALMISFAVFIIDYYNVPSTLLAQIPFNVILVSVLFFVIVSILILKNNHIFELLWSIPTNPIDDLAVIGVVSLSTYSVTRFFVIGKCIYTDIAICICLMTLIMVIVRYIVRCVKMSAKREENGKLIELRDLYEDNFNHTSNTPILLHERPIDYDLLGREGVVNHLFRSIIHSQNDQSYVISLVGRWGSGKTTIINNTKRLLIDKENNTKNYVVIDDFDPWLYGTQESLLMAMFDTLIHHLGMKYSPMRIKGLVDLVRKSAADVHWMGKLLQSIVDNSDNENNTVTKLKKRISEYLIISGKTVVFLIDNLDRANEENVVFLFKLISIVFDLPRVIYVLSYEQERIDKILKSTKAFDERFTEKIIQQEIKVPELSKEHESKLYISCIERLLVRYGVSGNELKDFEPTARYIVKKTNNTRMFIRMVNSVFPIVFCSNTPLRKSELLAMEAIHFFDSEAYYKIFRNPIFFISHEKSQLLSMEISFNREKFNQEAKEFFSKLFSEHSDLLELLSTVFPYVKKFKSKQELINAEYYQDEDYLKIVNQSRICSGKYFDLYFSYSTNQHINIQKSVQTLIDEVNNLPNKNQNLQQKSVSLLIDAKLSLIERDEQKEWMQCLQNHIQEIHKAKVIFVAMGLFELIYDLKDEHSFLSGLSARERAEYIICELLFICDDRDFSAFFAFVSTAYDKLKIISDIYEFMKGRIDKLRQVDEKRVPMYFENYTTICEQIVCNNIDLYSDEYYYAHNIWGLQLHYNACARTESFNEYVTAHITTHSIYRFLWDLVSFSISNTYTYSIKQETFERFVDDVEKVKLFISKNKPSTPDEMFVYRIFEAFCNGETDEWGRKGVDSTVDMYPTL